MVVCITEIEGFTAALRNKYVSEAGFDVFAAIKSQGITLTLHVGDDRQCRGVVTLASGGIEFSGPENIRNDALYWLVYLFGASLLYTSEYVKHIEIVSDVVSIIFCDAKKTDEVDVRKNLHEFAIGLLMPKHQILSAVRYLADQHEVKWRGHGIIYLDYEKYNYDTYITLVSEIAVLFQVSGQRVADRLKELGVLNDVRFPQPSYWSQFLTDSEIEGPRRVSLEIECDSDLDNELDEFDDDDY
jgi:hypothetical protein